MSEIQDKAFQRQAHQLMERHLRVELRRHALSERERLIADQLLDMSYGWGSPVVRLPNLQVLSDLTGIAVPHISTALRALAEMRIVDSDARDIATDYRINPSSDNWKVKIRVPRSVQNKAIEVVKAYNGMDERPEIPQNVTSMGGEGANPNFPGQVNRFHAPKVTNPVTDTVTTPGKATVTVFPSL